jgi:N-acetylglutamate synthase-like GNAT family acetyltransferase
MIIRDVEEKDWPQLLVMGKRMFDESAYSQVCTYNEEKILVLFEAAINYPNQYFFRVAEKDGTIIGMYGGQITDYYFSDDLMAIDFALYVDEKKRGGIAAIKLIQAFEDWAFAQGVKEICPATSTQIAPERTAQLYHLLGYEVVGNLFKKRK